MRARKRLVLLRPCTRVKITGKHLPERVIREHTTGQTASPTQFVYLTESGFRKSRNMAQRYENFPVRKTGVRTCCFNAAPCPHCCAPEAPRHKSGADDTARRGQGKASARVPGQLHRRISRISPACCGGQYVAVCGGNPASNPPPTGHLAPGSSSRFTPAAGSRRDPVSKSVGCRGGQNPPPSRSGPWRGFSDRIGCEKTNRAPPV